MAIDNRRKRASVAALGLAFLGPSIVPDGSFIQADRQAIAHSYYGITAAGAAKTIGGTSQLGAFSSTGTLQLVHTIGATSQLGALSSTGTLQVARVIGGTSQLGAVSSTGELTIQGAVEVGGVSQLEAHASTGGITLDRLLGDTSQLGAFTSSGGIQVGDAVVAEVQPTGGWAAPRRERKRRDEQDALSRFKTEEQTRRERIRLGIIPDDMPAEQKEAVKQAADEANTYLAGRRLDREVAALEQEAEDAQALRELLTVLLEAYQEDQQRQLDELFVRMAEESERISELRAEIQIENQPHANAVIVMLALLED